MRGWFLVNEPGEQGVLKLRPDLFVWAHLPAEALLQVATLHAEQQREMQAHIDNLYRDGQERTAEEYEKKLHAFRYARVSMPRHDELVIGVELAPWPHERIACYRLALTHEHGIRVRGENGPDGAPPMLSRHATSVDDTREIARASIAWILRRLAPFQGAFDVWGRSAA